MRHRRSLSGLGHCTGSGKRSAIMEVSAGALARAGHPPPHPISAPRFPASEAFLYLVAFFLTTPLEGIDHVAKWLARRPIDRAASGSNLPLKKKEFALTCF